MGKEVNTPTVQHLREIGHTNLQIANYIKMRAEYEAPRYIAETMGEIQACLKDKIPRPYCLETYLMYTAAPSSLDKKEQWNILDQEGSTFFREKVTYDNEAEEERLEKSFARRRVLNELGFSFSDINSPQIAAKWTEENKNDVTFMVAQSPKLDEKKQFFLVRTNMPTNGGLNLPDTNLLFESLLFAPNLKEAIRYWKENEIGDRFPITLTS